jgi:hypothetical protein
MWASTHFLFDFSFFSHDTSCISHTKKKKKLRKKSEFQFLRLSVATLSKRTLLAPTLGV